jgi:hypothetical protein
VRRITADDLLDLMEYEVRRDEIRQAIFAVKASRRIHVGEALTLLFENTETIRYQVLEMMRAERLFRPEDIEREIDTYNELLGDDGELGATLMIEIDDKAERDEKLTAWRDLPDHLYVLLADGRKARPTIDERQRDDVRVSAVQFLKFDTGGRVPVAIGCDFPLYTAETVLTETQRAALEADLA